jgi:hypothetical protein
MSIRHIVVAIALSCWLAAPPSSVAVAQPAPDVAAARELYVEGAAFSKEGNWAEAKERLGRSLALKKAPITLYMLAVAQQNTGELVEALENFRAFLAAPPQAATQSLRAPSQEAVEDLDKRVARVTIAILPADLRSVVVTVDGVAVPTAALDRKRLVNPGDHLLRANADGWTEGSRMFTVAEGEQAEIMLMLEREGEGPASNSLPAPPGVAVAAPMPAAAPAPPPVSAPADRAEQAADQGGSAPVGPVVLIAGGAAATGIGVAIGLMAVGDAEEAPTNDGPKADDARTQALAGDIVAGVGIAAATAGLIWLIAELAGDGDDGDASAQSPGARPCAAGAATKLELRF